MHMVRQDDPGMQEVQVVGCFSVAKRLLDEGHKGAMLRHSQIRAGRR
jgi:hypothetical protein